MKVEEKKELESFLEKKKRLIPFFDKTSKNICRDRYFKKIGHPEYSIDDQNHFLVCIEQYKSHPETGI